MSNKSNDRNSAQHTSKRRGALHVASFTSAIFALSFAGVALAENETALSAEEIRQINEMANAMCVEAVVVTVRSPDGRHVAALKTRDCGAVTREATHLILSGSAGPDANDESVFIAEFEGDARLNWKNDHELEVDGKCRRLFKATSMVGDVKLKMPECRDD